MRHSASEPRAVATGNTLNSVLHYLIMVLMTVEQYVVERLPVLTALLRALSIRPVPTGSGSDEDPVASALGSLSIVLPLPAL